MTTVKERIFNLLSDQDSLKPESTFYRISRRGNQYFYTISSRFFPDIKDHKIKNLKAKLKLNEWVELEYNRIIPKYLKLKAENKKLKERIKKLEI